MFDQLRSLATSQHNWIIPLARSYYERAEDFVLDMTFDLAHDYLFLTVHYPIFFIIQSIFYIISIKLACPNIPKKLSYFYAFATCILNRSIIAIIVQRELPFFQHPLELPILTLIWILVNFFPFDLIFRIFSTKLFYFLLYIGEVVVDVRQATHGADIGLRYFPKSISGVFLLAMIMCSFQYVILDFESLAFSGFNLFRNMLVFVIYVVLTQYSELVKDYCRLELEEVKIFELIGCLILQLIASLIYTLMKRKSKVSNK